MSERSVELRDARDEEEMEAPAMAATDVRPAPVPPARPQVGHPMVQPQAAPPVERHGEAAARPLDGARAALFPEGEAQDFRTRWSGIQAGFIDDPRQAVEAAHQLVSEATQRLAQGFAEQRDQLQQQWGQGDNVSTEDLRIALQRYRSFFDRLLSV